MTAESVKAWRQRLNLTQAQAAEAIGCSRRAIVNYESGTPVPKWFALACAALALGVKPHE